MASEPARASIADHVAQTLAAFEAIETTDAHQKPGDFQLMVAQTIGNQLAKFKLWAGNIGAHRTGRSSLDYRLRDSSHLRAQVMRLLYDLIDFLNELCLISSGEKLPWDQDPKEADGLDEEILELLVNENFEFDSEIDQLVQEVTDSIDNLLRLSMSLRNPAPHDHFMSTEYAKVQYFEENDRAHVEAKYPRASQILISRLGQGISQRRQYFRYRESHHEKMARGLVDSEHYEAGAQSTVASSIPIAMKVPGAAFTFRELDEDEQSDTGFSQTSFATTAPESDSLRIPPLPKRAHDGPFECPFCYMLISVSSIHQWKKHVLSDLRPYKCLAEDCTEAAKDYSRRHEWMDHMYRKHWRTWACPYQCGLDNTSGPKLHQHITEIHGFIADLELNAMIERSGRAQLVSPSSPVECPLCRNTLKSSQQYQQHVGRHQVDLVLFALPKIGNDDEESDEENKDQETISTASESHSKASSDDISRTALVEPARHTPELTEEGHHAMMGPSESQLSEDNESEKNWGGDLSPAHIAAESTKYSNTNTRGSPSIDGNPKPPDSPHAYQLRPVRSLFESHEEREDNEPEYSPDIQDEVSEAEGWLLEEAALRERLERDEADRKQAEERATLERATPEEMFERLRREKAAGESLEWDRKRAGVRAMLNRMQLEEDMLERLSREKAVGESPELDRKRAEARTRLDRVRLEEKMLEYLSRETAAGESLEEDSKLERLSQDKDDRKRGKEAVKLEPRIQTEDTRKSVEEAAMAERLKRTEEMLWARRLRRGEKADD
ncbi:hypothetical protein F4777DRAFT_574519 [Nemania sp. FL0916]|nr:hypothetical protein F4777DRAFT_574519 [Nemania sp. FL0916]